VSEVARYRVVRVTGAGARAVPDEVAVEQPLEVRVAGVPPFVTMRTPGHDADLVLGWLVAQGVVRSPEDVARVRERVSGEGGERAASVEVRLAAGVTPPVPRSYPVTSACGVCGADVAAVVRDRMPRPERPTHVDPAVLRGLPATMRAAQRGFSRTGGLHAAGLFRLADGTALVVREDVGRHNAVDKVVGWALRHAALPAPDCALQVSGRASYELVEKAAMAGITVLAAVSAPSSLAVDLARDVGLTLAAFVRDGGFSVYAGADRLGPAGASG
jgi:FdhD protein